VVYLTIVLEADLFVLSTVPTSSRISSVDNLVKNNYTSRNISK